MVVLERNEDGTPHRVTVAAWDLPTEEERPGRWRLDRIVDRPRTGDGSPFFELVDEAWPSHLLQGGGPDPIKLEYAPSMEEQGMVWLLTESWVDIRSQRSDVGARPVELTEKMVGLLLAMTGQVEPGYLFDNWKGADQTWLFVPIPIDAGMLDGAERLDRWMKTPHQATDMTLSMGPEPETLRSYLGKKVERTSLVGPTTYRVWASNEDPWFRLDYSRFSPRWSMSLFGRPALTSNQLRSVLSEAVKLGLFVTNLEEWTRGHSQIPKLLLDGEDVEVLRMLGETSPVLWLDDAFTEWMMSR